MRSNLYAGRSGRQHTSLGNSGDPVLKTRLIKVGKLVRDPRPWRAAVPFVAGMLLASCAHTVVEHVPEAPAGSSSYTVSSDKDVAACRMALTRAKPEPRSALDLDTISLVNWNIHKRRHPDLAADMRRLSDGKDLVLVQEASLHESTINEIDATMHWSFAPGYRIGDEITGVMTLSRAEPLTRCSLAALEPLMRTPKATSISEYALRGTDETLVVVNVHAINVTLGLEAFARQFEQVAGALEAHDGPIILSGDFNTWRPKRAQIVRGMTDALGLEPVTFDVDHRTRFFGHPLDHIYVRGLSPAMAATMRVDTSDHNPMSVVLQGEWRSATAD